MRHPLPISILASLLIGPSLAGAETETRRPNVVYIMSDELAYYEVSYMGHPQLRTPTIDRMASEGIRFTQ